MTTKIDGGTAFPYEPTCAHGMSLRDWFAGQALAGLMSKYDPEYPDWIVRTAFRSADAMLAERAK